MSTLIVKEAYQDTAVAEAYDHERFTNLAGRVLNDLERRAYRRVLDAALRGAHQPRVLDIPCGTGRLTEVVAQAGYDCVGGDISNQMMAVARQKLAAFGDRVSFEWMDLDRLDVPDNTFDLVSCIRLLHHLDSPQRAAVLQQLARISRRYVLINVSYSSPWYRLRRKLKQALGQGISRASSTWAEINDEAQAAGLQVRSVRFVLPLVSEDALILLEKQGA